MQNKNIIWHNSMTFGAILGGILVLLSLIGYIFFKNNNSTLLQILNYLALGGIMYYGTKVLRDKYQNGFIKYGRALASSFLIAFFAGIIMALFTIIYFKWLDPNLIEQMKLEVQQTLIEKGLPQSQIELSLKMMNPSFYAFAALFGFSFWGFLLSLIVALFVKKEENPFETFTVEENKNIEENKKEN